MTKRIISILIIVWTALAGITLAFYFASGEKAIDGITSQQTYASSEDHIYVAENDFGHAVIFQLDKEGKQDGLFLGRFNKQMKDYKVNCITYEQTLFALFSCPATYEGKEITAYRLARFGENMAISELSDFLVLGNDIRITYLSADENQVYISATNSKGSEGYVFQLAMDALSEAAAGGVDLKGFANQFTNRNSTNVARVTVEQEKFSALDPILFELSDNGRFYAGFAYEPGNLHTRYDNEKPDSFFTVPSDVEEAYSAVSVSSYNAHRMRGIHYVFIIIIWAIGIPVIVILCVLLRNRTHAVYTGVVIEAALFGVCLIGGYTILKSVSDLNLEEHKDFTKYVLGDAFTNQDFTELAANMDAVGGVLTTDQEEALLAYYDSDLYHQMDDELDTLLGLTGTEWGLTNLAVVNRSTGEVLLSTDNQTRISINQLYGKKVGLFSQISTIGSTVRTENVIYEGEERVALAKSLDSLGLSGYTLVGIARFNEDVATVYGRYKSYAAKALLIFAVASAFVIVFLYLESREIHAIARMLKVLAEGRGVLHNPNVRGRDLISMKNSTFEIEKNITSVNRAKYKIFEAYYRFAPKSIETLLGRDSITEVEIGDRAEIAGTMAIVSMKEKRRADGESLANMNKTFEILEKHRADHGGIYVANNETLSRARILFPPNNSQSVAFAGDVLNSMREWKKRENTDTLVLLVVLPRLSGELLPHGSLAGALLGNPRALPQGHGRTWRQCRLHPAVDAGAGHRHRPGAPHHPAPGHHREKWRLFL